MSESSFRIAVTFLLLVIACAQVSMLLNHGPTYGEWLKAGSDRKEMMMQAPIVKSIGRQEP